MKESFEKLKKRSLLSALIKSLIIGLSSGLVVAGVLILSLALSHALEFGRSVLTGALSGLFVAGAVFALCFLLMRPTDIKVARKYDNELGLNERLQTMVQFSGVENEMLSMQKADALEKLAGSYSAIKIKFSRIWYYIICGVLAIAVFSSGVAVPAVALSGGSGGLGGNGGGNNKPIVDGPPEVDDTFEYSDAMQSEFYDLINEVYDSPLAENVMNAMVDELYVLNDNLKEAETQGDKIMALTDAVTNIDSMILRVNTFEKFVKTVSAFDMNIANALNNGVAVYKTKIMRGMPQDYVYSLGKNMGSGVGKSMESFLVASYQMLCGEIMPENAPQDLSAVENFNSNVNYVLRNSGVAADDELYQVISAFYKEMENVRETVEKGGTSNSILKVKIGYPADETSKDAFDPSSIYKKLSDGATEVLGKQSFNCIMEIYVRQRLEDIFDMSFEKLAGTKYEKETGLDNLPELYPDLEYIDVSDEEEDPGNEEPPHQGGIGPGIGIYGSNALVYDWKTGEQVPYGTLLNKDGYDYEAKINQLIWDENTPDEVKAYLREYLNGLKNGIKDSDNTEN